MILSDSQISYQLLRDNTPPLSCLIHRLRLPQYSQVLSFTAPRFQSESVTRIKQSNKLPITITFYSNNNGLKSL